MREIEFRAWHKNNKSMCYDVATDLLDRDYLEFTQYTGLKDNKNNKKIFESDIIKVNNNDKYVGSVYYLDGVYRVHLTSSDPTLHWLYVSGYELEVIGNGYENPDLLGE